MIESNQGLVVYIAQNFINAGVKEPLEDLIGAGNVGLCRAAQQYNPKSGNRFGSLAAPWIRGEILHYLRDRGEGLKVPSNWRDIYISCKDLSDEEACEKKKITLEHWLEIKTACSISMISFESYHETAVDMPQDTDVRGSLLPMAKKTVEDWMRGLRDEDRAIVHSIYFLSQPRKERREKAKNIIKTLRSCAHNLQGS